jgi:hypothetical protein
MVNGERLEIRPKAARNAVLVAAGCLAFVVMGAWMVFGQRALEYRAVGVLSVVLFGCGLTQIPLLARRKVTLVLTPDALEQVYPQGVMTIPWADVAAVGVTSTGRGRPMAGIRLHSYDRYLEQMPPALAAQAERSARFMKPVAVATAIIAGGQSRGMLMEYSRTHDRASRLAWQRDHFGYDVVLGWSELDRPARDFVALLHEHITLYHGRSGQGGGPALAARVSPPPATGARASRRVTPTRGG